MESTFPSLSSIEEKDESGNSIFGVETQLSDSFKLIRFSKEKCKPVAKNTNTLLLAHFVPTINGVPLHNSKEFVCIVEPSLELAGKSYQKLFITWKYTLNPMVVSRENSWIPFLSRFE